MGWKNVLPENITPKQLRIFLEFRAATICKRSVQNEASHLRRAIAGSARNIGNIKDPNNNWSNQRLGVKSATRIGGKAAMSLDFYLQNKDKLEDGTSGTYRTKTPRSDYVGSFTKSMD
jgi:hypothetical protein